MGLPAPYLKHLAQSSEQGHSTRVAAPDRAVRISKPQTEDGWMHFASKLALCQDGVCVDLLQDKHSSHMTSARMPKHKLLGTYRQMEEREQAECVSHPVLLQMGKELQGMVGALLILLRPPAMLALAGSVGPWLGISLRLLCWTPACLASLSCLPFSKWP